MTPDSPLTDDDTINYDQINDTAILMDIAAQLDAIRRLLEQQATDATDAPTNTEQLRCTVCDERIPAEERKDHARQCFGWHKDMGDDALDPRYERVE
jgi:hypothetical protein